jgi:hypothetical protein
MKGEHWDFVLMLVLCIAFGVGGFAVGLVVGGESDKDRVRREAVEAGVAKWVCDPSSGKTEFQWIKQEGK